MSHGNERWFLDTEVAVKDDGTLLGFRTKALDDAGACLRYEPLGGVIWAQVTPGCTAGATSGSTFTQAMTNKAPVSPNRGYSRMQHLWFTERVIDIVAHELGSTRSRCARELRPGPRTCPYETPNGCVYDSGDYAAMRHRARADRLLDIEARRARPPRAASCSARHRLDARLRHEQLRPVALINPSLQFSGNNEVATVKLDIFGEIVVTLGTTPQGQGTRRRRPRSSPTSSTARRRWCTCARATTRTGTRTPASPARTRASSRSPASAR
jgi:2-furoyl-CoA dehydrogenase large subunit